MGAKVTFFLISKFQQGLTHSAVGLGKTVWRKTSQTGRKRKERVGWAQHLNAEGYKRL